MKKVNDILQDIYGNTLATLVFFFIIMPMEIFEKFTGRMMVSKFPSNEGLSVNERGKPVE